MNEPTVTRTVIDADLSRLAISAGRQDLLGEILGTTPVSSPQPLSARRPVVGRTAAALAVAATVAAVASLTVGPSLLERARESSLATAPVLVERALLDAPGWRLESISDPGPVALGGSAQYRGDGPTVEIRWYPADQAAARSSYPDLGAPTRAAMLGRMAKVYAYSSTDHVAIRPVEGATFIQVRGQGLDADAFDALLSQLVPVPEDLPTATGKSPADRDALIGRWQQDLELPAGVDYLDPHLPGLTPSQATAVTVLRGFACGWATYDYAAASKMDDDQARERSRDRVLSAMTALSTSAAAREAQGTSAPGQVDELLAAMRAGADPAELMTRCEAIQGG